MIANGVLGNIVQRLYEAIITCKCHTVSWYIHHTCINVILLMPVRKVRPSLC